MFNLTALIVYNDWFWFSQKMSPQKTSPQYQSDQKTEKKFTYGPKLADDNLTNTARASNIE